MESRASAGAAGAAMPFFILARVKIVPCSEGKTRPSLMGVIQKGTLFSFVSLRCKGDSSLVISVLNSFTTIIRPVFQS
jgi:hypothetical protein